MTSRATKLAVAAVLAASLPAAAAARDCDPAHHAPPAYGAPAAYPAYPGAPGPAPRHWREGSWRQRELARVRAEIGALEQRRAEVHARFGWDHRRVRRFERWYAVRRAELDRRWYELQAVAWR